MSSAATTVASSSSSRVLSYLLLLTEKFSYAQQDNSNAISAPLSSNINQDGMWGLQTGPSNGLTTSGSMILDPDRDMLLLTGTTQGLKSFLPLEEFDQSSEGSSDCFVATIQDGQWQSQTRLGFPTSSCSVSSRAQDRWFLAGNQQKEQKQQQYQPSESSPSEMIVDMELLGNRIETVTTSLLQLESENEETIHYTTPSAMTSDGDSVYLATMQVDRSTISGSASNSAVGIHKLHPGGVVQNLREDWSRVFSNSIDAAVTIASMIHVNDNLLLVAGGSPGKTNPLINAPTNNDDDWDGFITKINPQTGELHHTAHTGFISSQRGKDEFLQGLCVPSVETAEGASYESAYVVGTTEGILDGDERGGAFISKLDLESLNVMWTKQISGEYVQGRACSVSPDGEVVYLAGEVFNGDNVENRNAPHKSTKDDDVFVAQLSTDDGEIRWIRQIGSSEDESLSQGGGSLTVDRNGNALLYGNTFGSLARERSDDENDMYGDVFVLSFHRDNGANIYDDRVSSTTTQTSIPKLNEAQETKIVVAMAISISTFVLIIVIGTILWRRKHDEEQPWDDELKTKPTDDTEEMRPEDLSEDQIDDDDGDDEIENKEGLFVV